MLKVALIGSTGAVGQEFVVALDKHPWFNLTHVVSSEGSAGKKYDSQWEHRRYHSACEHNPK